MKRIFSLVIILVCFQRVASQTSLVTYNLSAINQFRIKDSKGNKDVRIGTNSKKLILFVFVAPECPLSRNYSSTINSFANEFVDVVDVYGVIPGKSYEEKEVKQFISTYAILFPVLMDGRQRLTKYLKASTTPEVILLDSTGALIYQGAIDDWAVSLGKKRNLISRHYLTEAVTNYINYLPVSVRYVEPVGCLINEY